MKRPKIKANIPIKSDIPNTQTEQLIRTTKNVDEPCKGDTPEPINSDACAVRAAPTELNPLLSVFTQGCISGLALIPPWALKKWRTYGTLF